ncbi:MAG TPA: hypothetical protein VNU68_15470 [Verrucomicrobiae bacterium]|nr:hypothetical protein [Verrucomicrobiae bacterium]
MNLKKMCLYGGGLAGLVYGTTAVSTVYTDAPWSLQLFIAVGVTLIGLSAGYIVGCCVGEARPWSESKRER